MIHVRIQDANIEPVFFAYPDNAEVNEIVAKYIAGEPEYDFTAADSFGHHFWVIDNQEDIDRITEIFADIPAFYVADGHHRTAAAARVGAEKRAGNAGHTGEEEYNWFMTVAFPDSQLKIIDYNRVVKAIMTLPSGILFNSSLINSIFGFSSIFLVTAFEKSSLAIAKAFPAGTEFSIAILMSSPPKNSISFFKSPLAFVISDEPKLLEHTNSAQSEPT